MDKLSNVGGAPSAIARLDKAAIWGGLALISLLAWGYLVCMPHDAASMAMMAMPMGRPGAAEVTLTFLMWVVMMAAMMVPSASPAVLMYAVLARAEGSNPGIRVWSFVAGYLAAWTIFSAGATLAQESLRSLSLLNEALSTAPALSAGLLIGAGIYQLSPLKNACLSRCRSPLGFFMTDWRGGVRGAFWMGLRHGGYCVGCCWLLMALLFVAGVMNLLWIAGLSALVLLEKASRYGLQIATATGVAFIVWGVWLMSGMPRPF